MELFRLFAMLVAVGCMVASLLGVGGAFDDRLDLFNHFAPMTLAVAIVAAATQLTPRKSWGGLTLICAIVAIVVSAASMAPEFIAKGASGRVAPRRQTIKVVELNLWSNNVDVPGTARWIAAQHADVVVLEEVIANSRDVPKLVRSTYPYRSGCEPAAPCTTLILSRVLPFASGYYPGPDAGGLHTAGWATFGAGAAAYTVVADHAPWPLPANHQQDQTALLASRLQEFDRGSLIVAGDFNSTPWSFSLRRQDTLFGLRRLTRALFTFPVQKYTRYRFDSPIPLLPLDHIYAGSSWNTVSVTRGPKLGSDHLPTVAVLTR